MPSPRQASIQPRFRTIDGLSIRFAQSEDPRTGAQALLLSPWPESLYAYEQVWPRLAAHAQLTALDLPGFGHSERRDALMSPQAMGEFVVRLADAFGLEAPHVVGPDVATGAALFAAARHPGRLRSLVVGSGGSAFPLQLGGRLKEFVDAPDLTAYRQLDGRQAVERALERIEGTPSDAAREDYLSGYAGERFVASMSYVRTYPSDLKVLRELLRHIQTPVQIIAGKRDGLVPSVNGEYLAERLPASQLAILDSDHYVWEDHPEEYAALVTSWWNGGYAAVGHRAGATHVVQR